MAKRIFKYEFLIDDEIKELKKQKLTNRQIKIIDLMKSWNETRGEGFTLATSQISNELGVCKKTIDRDLIVLRCKGIVTNQKTKVSGVKFNVNSYSINLFQNVPTNIENVPTKNISLSDNYENVPTKNVPTNFGQNDNKMSHSNTNTISNTNSITNTNNKTITNNNTITNKNNIENKNNNLNNIENMENYVTIEDFKKFKKDLFNYYKNIIDGLQNEIKELKDTISKIENVETTPNEEEELDEVITNFFTTPTLDKTIETPQTTGNAPSSHSITPKVETIKPIEVSPTEGKTISDEDLHNWCMAFNAKLSKKTETPTVEDKQDDSKPMSDFEKEIRGKLDRVKTIPTVEVNETPVQRAIREFNEGKDKFKILISLNETDQEEFGDYLKATLYSDQQSHFNTSTIKDNTPKVETISEVSEEPTEDNFEEIEKRVEFIERFNMTRYEDCETKDEMNQTYCDINGDIIKDYSLTFEDRSYANKLNQELIIEYKEAI